MKKLFIIIFCLLPLQTLAFPLGFIPAITASSTPAGKTYLLQETFEAANLTNLSGYNSWTGTSSDELEISSAITAHGGSTSLKITGTSNVVNYKAFSQSQSGTVFTVDFWEYGTAGSSQTETVIVPSNGAYVYGTTSTWPELIEHHPTGSEDALRYFNGGGHTIIADPMPLNQWNHIEIQYNLDATPSDTMDIWMNGTHYGPLTLTHNGGSVAGISFESSAYTDTTYIDDLEVYTGARQ